MAGLCSLTRDSCKPNGRTIVTYQSIVTGSGRPRADVPTSRADPFNGFRPGCLVETSFPPTFETPARDEPSPGFTVDSYGKNHRVRFVVGRDEPHPRSFEQDGTPTRGT